MADIKWSAFPSVTSTTADDSVVGLHSGANERFLVTATPAASGIALWDANSNLSANNFLAGYATTATAAATTTLLVGSKQQQFFTGVTTQVVLLPVTSTLVLGQSFYIVNNSTGVVTIESSGANVIQAMAAGSTLLVTCILTSGTTAASWNAQYALDADLSGAVLLAPSGTQTITTYGLNVPNLVANTSVTAGLGAGGSAGSLISFPLTTGKGRLVVAASDNATGAFDTTITNALAVGQAQLITIPDSGASTAKFILSTGAGQTIGNGLTITTPKIAQILDANGNVQLNFTSIASAVNYLTIYNNGAGGGPYLFVSGADTNTNLNLQPKGTGQLVVSTANTTTPLVLISGATGNHTSNFSFANTTGTDSYTFPDASGTVLLTGQAISTVPSIAFSSTSGIIGTTTNDNAAAGSVGEYIVNLIPAGSPTSLTSGAYGNLATITLTAGDWDVWASVGFNPGAGTIFGLQWVQISTTSATIGPFSDATPEYLNEQTFPANATSVIPIGTGRLSLSISTIVYLVTYTTFSVSTASAYGYLAARRVR